MENFLKGVAIGIAIAAPVGPIGLLCIRRSIADGRTAGFVTGLGAATADGLYGLIAALGLTAVTGFLLDHRAVIQLFGGAFLVYLGIALLRAKPPAADAPMQLDARTLATAYSSTFVLTLANPVTILSFIGIFAGIGADLGHGGTAPAMQLVAGVFLGSAAWWLFLSTGAHYLGGKIGLPRLPVINRISGSFIAAFGLCQLVSLSR
jgi:threonine/homoserine/homoserine lactone efflux protein